MARDLPLKQNKYQSRKGRWRRGWGELGSEGGGWSGICKREMRIYEGLAREWRAVGVDFCAEGSAKIVTARKNDISRSNFRPIDRKIIVSLK